MAFEAFYDVYSSPRIAPVQFGDFFAGDHSERETLVQSAKFVRRAHRARAWFAKEEIGDFLVSPRRQLGHLMAALETAKADAANPSFSDEKQQDAAASAECIDCFISLANKLTLTGKELIAVDGEQFPVKIGGVPIQIEFSCLIRSVDKAGDDRIGALFLNTQKGKGLGIKEDTKKKREKAGESIALLVFKRLQDEFSDMGAPLQDDALHVYARGNHFWSAPNAYATKLKNMDAAGRAIISMWETAIPPADFDPKRAKMHD
jgi:hypothetical protein